MSKKKYIYSFGLRFYAEEDAQRLTKYAAKGWLFTRMTRLGFYQLDKSEPQQVKFAIDYFKGEKEDYEEYLAMYQMAGWTLVVRDLSGYQFFKGDLSAKNLYTDEETYKERLKEETRGMQKTGIKMAFMSVPSWLIFLGLRYFEHNLPNWFYLIASSIFLGIAVFLTIFGLVSFFIPYSSFLQDKMRTKNLQARQEIAETGTGKASKLTSFPRILLNILFGGIVGAGIGFFIARFLL